MSTVDAINRHIKFEFDLSLSGKLFKFKVTNHFVERAVERGLFQEINESRLREVITRSVIIRNRPNKVGAIMDHGFKDNVCLYDSITRSIIVVEETNTLVTIYTADDSRWSQQWLSKTPKGQRELFKVWANKPIPVGAIVWKR
jgi:hypothetical protein